MNMAYNVIALIPGSSGFSLDKAIAHFGSLTFRGLRLTSEFVRNEHDATGFRVQYGAWAVVAWLDISPRVLEDSRELANSSMVYDEQIGACATRLSIVSDDDPELDHSDDISHFTDELRTYFGLFIYDPVNGEFWQ